MRRIELTYAAFMAVLTILWLVADPILWTAYEFYAFRTSLINYTGVIGIGAMSAAMITALRPVSIEPFLGGLDRIYRLHKWLGITGLVFSTTLDKSLNTPARLSGSTVGGHPALSILLQPSCK